MSIGPILPGRIPGSLMSTRLRQNLERSSLLLARLRDQVATGQKFFLPSESPAAAARTIFLQKMIERQSQLQTNVNTDRSLLSTTESVLADVTNFLNQGKSFLLAGVGDSVSPVERESMAIETAALIRGVVNAANSSFRGRYLFSGSQSLEQPFEILTGGYVRYNGDRHNIESFVDFNLLIANNVDGDTAFAATTQPVGSDVDPALTLDTKLADLLGGDGVERGSIVVTIDDGVNPVQTETVDFSNAESIRDIKTILEDAFSGEPPTLTVDIDPASNFGLRLTPSGGTVAVADVPGSKVAAYLGIESPAAATINGTDLDPRLTRLTPLSALNNGAGATVADGLFIINGPHSQAVDLSTATTVEELFNILEAANLDLDVGINEAGNGLAIASRLSGANFSIGENNGGDAASLGIRTFDGTTLLADLNLGRGVPLDEGINLEITRRDGSISSIDLSVLQTVQDVIDAITAVDADLTASLNAVGNGISITDTSGMGPLTIESNMVSTGLGIAGTEPGPVNTVPLVGEEVNYRQANGVLSVLIGLETALRNGDDIGLARLDPLLNREIERFTLVRGEVGSRLKVIDDVESRLLDQEVLLQQSLSKEFDVDLTTAIIEMTTTSTSIEATLLVASQSLQLSLFNYL